MEVKFLDVKQLRTDLGITQLELSKKLDTPQGYLSQVENGKRKPSKELIEKLKSLLGKRKKLDKYWVAQQPKTLHKAAALGYRFLVNSGQRECDDGNHADDTVDREQHFPSQPERGDDSRCAPHGDIRCQKRGNSLNELSKRQRGRQVARDDVANQRIK